MGAGVFREKTLEEARAQTGAQKSNLVTKALQTLACVALISWWKREGGKDDQKRLETL